MSVVCIGQIVADMVARPVDALPIPGQAVRVDDLQVVAGGCAANTASVLSKLGVTTSLVGMVGCDALADMIITQLSALRVDVSGVVRSQYIPTSSVMVLVSSSGERSFLYREGGNEMLSLDMIPSSALRKAKIVHVGGAMKLFSLDLAQLLMMARDVGCVTSLDTDWDISGRWETVLRPALPHIDYLMTNEDEGGMLTGRRSAIDIGRHLLEWGPRVVVVKRGSLGAVVVTGETELECATFKVPVKDTTCAGDAFVAGFLCGVSHGWDIRETLVLANAVGALCTTQISHKGVVSLAAALEFARERGGVAVHVNGQPLSSEKVGLHAMGT